MVASRYLLIGCLLILAIASFTWLSPLSSSPPASATVVTHIVLFQFQKTASAESIKDVLTRLAALKDQCIHPSTQKPYILSLKGGTDNSPERLQGGMTHAFIMEFANTEDRDYYVQKDPIHLGFIKVAGEILEKTQIVDFIDGVFV
ncbi:hypothetical protein DTO271D3_5742 [Paecilomyces variotii]|nr:hypothetical protein DTO169C6_8553 [Paecilomyces variotii]KAJ9240874.1 hypothetical protein DTO169E5_3791 [Paecilomyces variotii]KAJ9251583.1 hypothetical protein DTO207G8_5263 [Paecilomyces variotii]KAJ9314054.1 hypothetical protein DTO271D3_5742 [Paecilomyces variotii]KAJ9383904.1 hypothetical protein DTO063F5_5008 [Paecilomyces variotii]